MESQQENQCVESFVPQELPKTVKVVIVDLRRKLALWVLNKAQEEKIEEGYKIPAKPEGWGLPGGGVEKKDKKINKDGVDITDIQAAKREIREETGLEIELDEYDLKLPEENHDKRHVLIVFMTSDFHGKIHTSPTEEIEKVEWFSVSDPPKNSYLGDWNRYWNMIKLLKSKGVIN